MGNRFTGVLAALCLMGAGCQVSGLVGPGPGGEAFGGDDDDGRSPDPDIAPGSMDAAVAMFTDATVTPQGDGAVTEPETDSDSGTAPAVEERNDTMLVAVGERLLRTTYQDGVGVTSSFNRDPQEEWKKWYILRDVECGPGRCVAVGDGYTYVTTRPNEWVAKEHGMSWLGGVAYGDGWYVAAGGNLAISRSRDGLTWEPDRWLEIRALVGSRNEDSDSFRGIGYGNGMFVAVGEKTVAGSPYPIGLIVTSSDGGVTWVRETLPSGAGLQGVGYGRSGFVAVGYGGRRIRSKDGHTWDNDETEPALKDLRAALYADGKYVVSGDNGFAISPTGAAGSWTLHLYPGQFTMGRVAFLKGRFFVAAGGALKSTTDFVTWKIEGQVPAAYWAIASGTL